MRRRNSSSESGAGATKAAGQSEPEVVNLRNKPAHIYDNLSRRLLQLGLTLSLITFVGLIVRYAVQEFDPSISTITVTTSRVNNRDIASLSVSKNFLERILEFVEQSLAILLVILPLGFPICTLANRQLGKMRAGSRRFHIKDKRVLEMLPKYVILGDALVCQWPGSGGGGEPSNRQLKPLVRDTIYHLIKARLKPKLICEDSHEEARKIGIRMGLIGRDHHKLAVIKSVDLLKIVCDSRGDIKLAKVRYLLSRLKIMSQATPADKSLLVYLIKQCEVLPNEQVAYVGHSFTDPEAMRLADCALMFENRPGLGGTNEEEQEEEEEDEEEDDKEEVKRAAQVVMKSKELSFTDLYLFLMVCLLTNNIIQSYALYQISASVSSALYRFLSITIFQEQLISHSQFQLIITIQQVFAIAALMTKWISSLPREPLREQLGAAELAHRRESYSSSSKPRAAHKSQQQQQHRSTASIASISAGQLEESSAGAGAHLLLHKLNGADDTLGSSSLDDSAPPNGQQASGGGPQR